MFNFINIRVGEKDYYIYMTTTSINISIFQYIPLSITTHSFYIMIQPYQAGPSIYVKMYVCI